MQDVSRHVDPAKVAWLDARAHELLAAFCDPGPWVCQAPGRTRRRTWVGAHVVVTMVDAGSLSRAGNPAKEAQVTARLRAAGAPVPDCVAAGFVDGDGSLTPAGGATIAAGYGVWERLDGRALSPGDMADDSLVGRYLDVVAQVADAFADVTVEPVSPANPWTPLGVPDAPVALVSAALVDDVAPVVRAARELPTSVCHGDLGPSNVLVGATRAWAVDFEHTGPAPGATPHEADLALVAAQAVRKGYALPVAGLDPGAGARCPQTLAVAAHLVSRTGMHLAGGQPPAAHHRALSWLRVFLAAGRTAA